MNHSMDIKKPTKMTELLDKLNTIGFLFGFNDIWVTDIKFSSKFIYAYKAFKYVIEFINVLYSISILGSFFTQNNLTDDQAIDRLMFSIILPGNMLIYYISLFYKEETRSLLYQLVVVLKQHYNDVALEREMIDKIKMYSMSLSGLVYLVAMLYGARAFYRVITADENFIIITPAWPDVRDNSTAAGAMRIFFYFWWYPFVARIMVTFLMFVTMLLAICYQFKNMQSYFYSLNDIFRDKTLTQTEKELKYEQAFKVGIQMHAHTLWCKKQHQRVSKEMFATEIIVFVGMLMTELVTILGGERTLTQLSTMVFMAISTCLSLGFFMWNGGDITIEASKLSEAIYCSGWHHCYGQSSVRIRKLVVSAIRQAQIPVVYKTFGVVEFSYESFVTLVKMAYTAVGVLLKI